MFFYVKGRYWLTGPYLFDDAMKVCGFLNAIDPGSAALVNEYGEYVR